MYIIPLCSLKVNTYRKKTRRSGKSCRDRLVLRSIMYDQSEQEQVEFKCALPQSHAAEYAGQKASDVR